MATLKVLARVQRPIFPLRYVAPPWRGQTNAVPHRVLRRAHARTLSYSFIPKVLIRSFKAPIAGVTVGAGALGYANYKLEGT